MNRFENAYSQGLYALKPIPSRVCYTYFMHHVDLTCNSDMSFLDLGCGSGSAGWLLNFMRPGLPYVGVDSSKAAIDSARNRCISNALFVNDDIVGFLKSQPDDKYTYLLADDSLYYLSEAHFTDVIRAIGRQKRMRSFRFTVKTDRDQHAMTGEPISNFLFSSTAGWESGMSILCYPYEDLLRLSECFLNASFNVHIGYEKFAFGFDDAEKSTWVVTGIRRKD